MNPISIIKYSFTVIGLGVFVGAFFLFINTQDFLSESLTTDGTVVDLVRSRSRDSNIYKPVIKFVTPGDLTIKFKSSFGSSHPRYSKGDIVEVLYAESSPERAKINSFVSVWGGTIILGVLGTAFFLTGISIKPPRKIRDRKLNI